MTRVLIVDDKEENLYYLSALLGGNGCQVESARHGAEALVKARQSPPDLIVSDLLMPVMDGYTLLRHWKAEPRLRHIPFIVYTATYTEAEDERLALNLGADAFILKPAEPEDFLARLREVQANAKAAVPVDVCKPQEDEHAMLKVYSETLIRKLEEKSLQLESANQALHEDIASRKVAEISLRESEQRFRQLAENINEVFWITDLAGEQMLYVSPAYEKIWGESWASLRQAPQIWRESIHAEDRERMNQAVRSIQNGREYDEVYRIVRKDGTTRWIHDRAYPVRNERGELYRVVGTAEDITEQKMLEQQFLRAQRMESIGTLAGGIAHDLNNVLTPILLSVQLLKGDEKDPAKLSLLSAVEISAQRGADMVKQVLSFARGMEGRQLVVQMGVLIKEIEKIVNETFLKNIQVTSHCAPDLRTLQGDPTQLHQILLNLCVNARDAMPNGGKLALTAGNIQLDEQYAAMNPEAKPGPYILVQVEDSGTGMPPEVVERIFEPFFTTKEQGKGTGLGLSTVLAIVKSHGGFLRVYSEVGKGTKFHIYLPARTGSSAGEQLLVENDLPRGKGEWILVVDDEEAIQQITRQTLEAFGYRVLLASDGAEAVAVYAERMGDIAVILTDMMMPVMDGPATIHVIQRMNPQARIIAASGLNANSMVAKAANAGVKQFIPKPYTADLLLRAVHKELTATQTG